MCVFGFIAFGGCCFASDSLIDFRMFRILKDESEFCDFGDDRKGNVENLFVWLLFDMSFRIFGEFGV